MIHWRYTLIGTVLILALLSVSIAPFLAHAATVDGSVVVDNWLDGNAATTNRDGLGQLRVGDQGGSNKARQVVRFTMPSHPGGSVVIDKIEVLLYFTSRSGAVDMATKVTHGTGTPATSWNETQSTWNVYSTGNNWTVAGAASDFPSDTLDEVTLTAGSLNTYTTYTIYGTGASKNINATWGDTVSLLFQQTDTAATNYQGNDRLDANPPVIRVTYSTVVPEDPVYPKMKIGGDVIIKGNIKLR